MIPTAPFMSPEELLRHSQAICDGMSEDEDGLRREVLAHAGSRWSLGIIHALGVYGTLRHAEVATDEGDHPAHAYAHPPAIGT